MAKTSLFRSLQQALKLSHLSDSEGVPADEVAEWAKSPAGISRREFLKKGLMGAVGLAALSLLPSAKWLTESDTKIVIVGAGMAGLHAAHVLKKANVFKNVMIYEASNRTGGRMFTKILNNNTGTTELGGEFVDENHADIRQLAAEFGIKELYKSTDTLDAEVFWLNGNSYHQSDFIRAFQSIRKKVALDAKKRGKDLVALDKLSLAKYIKMLAVEPWFKKFLEIAYVGEYGLDAEEQSALNFIALVGKQPKDTFDLFGESDESIKLLGGNQQLCDRMAENLKDQIVLDAPLLGVRSEGKGFKLSFANMKQEVSADIVIMTLPYTVLRGIDGVAALSEMTKEKMRCIQELGAGQNGKYFLDMSARVWREQGYQGYLYTSNIHTAWDSYHLQNRNAGKSIYSIFLGGKAGLAIEDKGGKAFVDEIDGVFPGFKSKFTGYTTQMNWAKHRWSMGSYICPRPGQYSELGEHIAKPVGNMLFAGEHVSVEFGGFMNGAAETGRLAAEQVLKMLKAR